MIFICHGCLKSTDRKHTVEAFGICFRCQSGGIDVTLQSIETTADDLILLQDRATAMLQSRIIVLEDEVDRLSKELYGDQED